jgi:hypothetical protein
MTTQNNAARVAVQAEPCPKSSSALELIHSADWEVVEKAKTAGTLDEMVAMMVRQVEEPNGAPLFLFMPLVDAVLAQLAQPALFREQRGQQTRIAAQKGGAA